MPDKIAALCCFALAALFLPRGLSAAESCRPSAVFGTIAEADQHAALHPRFAKAFAFLRGDLSKLKPGERYEIDGSNCWAFVQDCTLKPVTDQNQYEAHGAFIDIQAPISGDETYGTMKTPPDARAHFDAKKDIVLFRAKGEIRTLRPGEFAIFLPPYGAHAPGLSEDGPRRIRKIVIKVRD
ncbi:MAG: YhcH/YjgK/YiaL family protein [Kiritimatiellae bacterium]|nr:YhcH/YjgK/YiaL family protein [Kiritimatiellia bacterium]